MKNRAILELDIQTVFECLHLPQTIKCIGATFDFDTNKFWLKLDHPRLPERHEENVHPRITLDELMSIDE